MYIFIKLKIKKKKTIIINKILKKLFTKMLNSTMHLKYIKKVQYFLR